MSSHYASQLVAQVRMIATQAIQGIQVKITLGEVSDYDPATHRVKVMLPMVRDENQDIQETGLIPLGTFFTGPGYGAQFPPIAEAQVLVLYTDHAGFDPVGALLLFNDLETPPFPEGTTWGWLDAQSNFVKTTADGASSGDGAGGARVGGASYASVVAPKVELGAEGLSSEEDVVRRKDLQTVVDQMNAAIMIFNSHMHPGVMSGSSMTLAPVTMQENLTAAEASSTVTAND